MTNTKMIGGMTMPFPIGRGPVRQWAVLLSILVVGGCPKPHERVGRIVDAPAPPQKLGQQSAPDAPPAWRSVQAYVVPCEAGVCANLYRFSTLDSQGSWTSWDKLDIYRVHGDTASLRKFDMRDPQSPELKFERELRFTDQGAEIVSEQFSEMSVSLDAPAWDLVWPAPVGAAWSMSGGDTEMGAFSIACEVVDAPQTLGVGDLSVGPCLSLRCRETDGEGAVQLCTSQLCRGVGRASTNCEWSTGDPLFRATLVQPNAPIPPQVRSQLRW
jgi:hypothetical protein